MRIKELLHLKQRYRGQWDSCDLDYMFLSKFIPILPKTVYFFLNILNKGVTCIKYATLVFTFQIALWNWTLSCLDLLSLTCHIISTKSTYYQHVIAFLYFKLTRSQDDVCTILFFPLKYSKPHIYLTQPEPHEQNEKMQRKYKAHWLLCRLFTYCGVWWGLPECRSAPQFVVSCGEHARVSKAEEACSQ